MGLVKFCAPAGLTIALAETAIVGVSEVMAVPYGTVTVMSVPLMVPFTPASSKLVMSFALDLAAVFLGTVLMLSSLL